MPPTATANATEKRPLGHTLLAGGTAGFVESSVCHPLDTVKTRMQLRNNHVESVSHRLRHSLVEPAVLRVRHSLVEPALRLRNKHSFVEPGHLVQLRHQPRHQSHHLHHLHHHHSYAEPSLIRPDVVNAANAANTANGGAATHNSTNTPQLKAGATRSKGSNAAVASKTRVVDPVSGARPERPFAVNAANAKNASPSPSTSSSPSTSASASTSTSTSTSTKQPVARNSSAAKCWWNLPQQRDRHRHRHQHRKRNPSAIRSSSKRTFLSSSARSLPRSIAAEPASLPVHRRTAPTTARAFAGLGCGNPSARAAQTTHPASFSTSSSSSSSSSPSAPSSGPWSPSSRCGWWNPYPPNRKPRRTTATSTADASNRSFQTRRVPMGPLSNSISGSTSRSSKTATNACRTTSRAASASSSASAPATIGHPPAARAGGGSGAASGSALVANSKAWWNWHKHLPSTIAGRGQSSKSAVWWQPMNETYGRRTHATLANNSSSSSSSSSNVNDIKLNAHKPTSVAIRKGPLGPIQTARRIIQKEGFLSLYKGLSAVYVGIIPKMAIRFVSFEHYRDRIETHSSLSTGGTNFAAGLLTGLTEAVLIVTPADVCKIRMQSQRHSLLDPLEANTRKYGNVVQTAFTIVREEGSGALYKGVVPTMLRQGCNQAVNFTAYNAMKSFWLERQRRDYCLRSNDSENGERAARMRSPGPHEQLSGAMSLLIGGLSGAMGPVVNNPLDVVKTRLQKQNIAKNASTPPKYTGLVQACFRIANEEGAGALWKGITPRLMRIVPGQAITFTTYEAVCRWL